MSSPRCGNDWRTPTCANASPTSTASVDRSWHGSWASRSPTHGWTRRESSSRPTSSPPTRSSSIRTSAGDRRRARRADLPRGDPGARPGHPRRRRSRRTTAHRRRRRAARDRRHRRPPVRRPSAPTISALEAAAAETAGRDHAARARAAGPASTADGIHVEVLANLGETRRHREGRAGGGCRRDGVGLLRTEFLFIGRASVPEEDEQERAYRAAAEALDGRPLTIRTLDVGADKRIPGSSSRTRRTRSSASAGSAWRSIVRTCSDRSCARSRGSRPTTTSASCSR